MHSCLRQTKAQMCSLVLFVLMTGCWLSKEIEIRQTDMPQAVTAAFEKSFPRAIVEEYARDTEDGETSKSLSFKMAFIGKYLMMQTVGK